MEKGFTGIDRNGNQNPNKRWLFNWYSCFTQQVVAQIDYLKMNIETIYARVTRKACVVKNSGFESEVYSLAPQASRAKSSASEFESRVIFCFNKHSAIEFEHWGDTLVYNTANNCAVSPDGMNAMKPPGGLLPGSDLATSDAIEIKSFCNPELDFAEARSVLKYFATIPSVSSVTLLMVSAPSRSRIYTFERLNINDEIEAFIGFCQSRPRKRWRWLGFAHSRISLHTAKPPAGRAAPFCTQALEICTQLDWRILRRCTILRVLVSDAGECSELKWTQHRVAI